jgi:hypothetical protein
MPGRVTGSLIIVRRESGQVCYMKARDRDGRQIKLKLGPIADWPTKRAQDALRDFLTDLGRVPERGESRSRSPKPPPRGCGTSSTSATGPRRPCATIAAR